MLAHLLRRVYLFQVITGAVLGAYAAVHLAQHGWGAAALTLVPLGAVLFALLMQVMVIAYTMLVSRPAQDTALWWQAVMGELRAAIQIFWFQLPWTIKPPGVLLAQGPGALAQREARVPVLLVHGYICNYRVWDTMVQALRSAGHPVLAINLEPLFTSIDDYAPLIAQGVKQLQSQTGGQKVALIGHSMGGLAIRAWLRASGSRQVARILTLGTPHWGTQIASLTPTTNAAQMAWHSVWLEALHASESPDTRVLMHIALTQHDNIVYPQRAQVLEGATVTEFKGLGHLQLCTSPVVIQWVQQQLAHVGPSGQDIAISA
jgi:triacylglycerol esterase/lipase EstA (alpha/beta hydrolase family)